MKSAERVALPIEEQLSWSNVGINHWSGMESSGRQIPPVREVRQVQVPGSQISEAVSPAWQGVASQRIRGPMSTNVSKTTPKKYKTEG